MIKDTDEYLSDIMRKVLNSYSIIENLSDQPDDLQVLEIELKKINGFLLVLIKKVNLLNDSPHSKKLEKRINLYFQNHDFSSEINLLLDTYANDIHRVKNIRDSVISSLNDNKLIEMIYEIYNELK